MGPRFKDGSRDSIHLTSPGWQALGVFYHDLRYKLSLSDVELKDYAGRAASIDWSRYNSDWIPMLGQPEIDKVTNSEITDSQGRKKVAIQGAGRSNVQNILDYLRRKLDLAERVSEPAVGEGGDGSVL